MTLVDTDDMLARTCRVCGAVVWDRVSHQRWHRGIDALVDGLEHVRNVLVGLEDLDHLRHDEPAP